MQGTVVVITGATSGIGEVAARRLAGMGARIVLIARDKTRGEAALTRLRSASRASPHSIHYGDLSRISEMKRLAAEIAAAEPRIDVLINNAGAIFGSRRMTADDLELDVCHQSYGLFRAHAWAAGATIRFGAGAGRQHRLGCS